MDLDFSNPHESLAISVSKKNFNSHRLNLITASPPSSCFEIRLFYVRISPCYAVDSVPALLTLYHLRRDVAAALEINGSRLPTSETTASLSLRRDRIHRDSSEVTYVSTDSVRVAGPVDFEVYEADDLILCGSLERMEPSWKNGGAGFDNHYHQGLDTDFKTGWRMDCFSAASLTTGSSAFFQPKLRTPSPSIDVYVAGCCSGFPIILSKTIHLSPKRKPVRHVTLDSIPEDEETGREHSSINGFCPPPLSEVGGCDDDDSDWKIGHDFYSEGRFSDDGGQLTWFNAGVRVGVGIGLGMCLGMGIGVGLLMRSYQATTRTFKRKFL